MKGFVEAIGRWWGWIWTRAHAGVKSKAGQSESRSWCKVRLTSQSGGRVYGVSSIWANPNPLLHGQCLQLFHPQAEASKIECKSGICERTVDLASQHETLLTERWLSLLPWGRKMTWFSSQATPLLQMNYYTRIKNSFSCKNRLLLLEPPATFFFSSVGDQSWWGDVTQFPFAVTSGAASAVWPVLLEMKSGSYASEFSGPPTWLLAWWQIRTGARKMRLQQN